MPKAGPFIKNAVQTVGSTVISSAMLACLALLLPRYIEKDSYGYYQLYLFYATYLGYVTFGIADGLFLRFAGYDLRRIPGHIVSAHLRFLALVAAPSLMGAVALSIHYLDEETATVVSIACLGTFFYLLRSLLTFVYQAANAAWLFAQSTVLERLLQLSSAVILLLSGYRGFTLFLWTDAAARLIGLLYTMFRARAFVTATPKSACEEFQQLRQSVKSGIFINLAAVATVLVTAVGRLAAEKGFGIGTFAEASLAFSLQNIVLTVVAPISLVMLPSLRRKGKADLPGMYQTSAQRTAPFLVFTVFAYFPLSLFSHAWLPDYNDLPLFIGAMTPIVLFETRTRVFAIPFLQALRRERSLAFVNVICLQFAAASSYLAAYTLRSAYALMLSLTVAVALRSLALQLIVERTMRITRTSDSVIEVALVTIFVIAANGRLGWAAWTVVCTSYFAYAFAKRRTIVAEFQALLRRG